VNDRIIGWISHNFTQKLICYSYKLHRFYNKTRKNCFRYLKLMSPLNKWYFLKKQLFDLEVKGQGPTKAITVRDTPPYDHVPTYQISLTYLERVKCYGPDKKILSKNNYLTLRSKVKVTQRSLRYVTHCLMVMHPQIKYNWLIWKEKKFMIWTSFAEKKRKKEKSD
jgi:hypothetical protein